MEKETNKLMCIVYAICIVLVFCLGLFIGRYNIIASSDGISLFNYKEAYLAEKAIANASLELNHLFYSNDDNEFWYDVVINTTEYQHLDSCLNGDWEDFYLYSTNLLWDSITYE